MITITTNNIIYYINKRLFTTNKQRINVYSYTIFEYKTNNTAVYTYITNKYLCADNLFIISKLNDDIKLNYSITQYIYIKLYSYSIIKQQYTTICRKTTKLLSINNVIHNEAVRTNYHIINKLERTAEPADSEGVRETAGFFKFGSQKNDRKMIEKFEKYHKNFLKNSDFFTNFSYNKI